MSKSEPHQHFVADFKSRLVGRSVEDIHTFFDSTMGFVENYCAAYALKRPIYLVLDNSLVQDFKHTKTNPVRALRASSFAAFCRFVQGWSDRPSYLVISPVCIYEHIGRRILTTAQEGRARRCPKFS